ncbi:MAG TPA: carboxymuconolactone decarboxylase family protein [Mariprofundaceae bacterium]|nr:carboxymuconolactone decarboxylase family protein [Mariprofundaceae bacterium]
MTDTYKQLTTELSATIGSIRKDIPDVMKGFSAMAGAALEDGALSKKTKEMMALSIGIATHCRGCIGFHVKALIALGITREELAELLGMAVYMGGGPSLMYAAEAMQAYEEFSAS